MCWPSGEVPGAMNYSVNPVKITHSAQSERDRLLGSHRRAFRPGQFKHDISKLSAYSGQYSRDMLLGYLFERRSNANPQGFGCRQELNRLFVAFFLFVDLGESVQMSRDSPVVGPNGDECAALRRVIPWRSHALPSLERFLPGHGWLWRRHAGNPANDRHPGFEECLSRCRVFADFQQVHTKIYMGFGEFKRALQSAPKCDVRKMILQCCFRLVGIESNGSQYPIGLRYPSRIGHLLSHPQRFIQPAPLDSRFCQPTQPDRNTSTGRRSPPVDRQAAETTAELAECTATHTRNR